MATDTEIFTWFKELGMKVDKVTSGGVYFHFTVSPPMGGLPVSVIRTTPESTYYIVAVILDLDQSKFKDNPSLISQVKRELLRLNVEFFFTPDEKAPRSVQIARILFAEGLSKNEALNTVTLIKNAALLVLELQK
ncbi:hypothetical protein L3N51_01570 [Metallosphaera sp. J1]|uniref:DUF2299 domain-containing protein n=1 Tax=Metallosphaera javensis (ex Hofmann et al. 2022) TaxID=99938 RepID=UPI001EDFCC1A|nr:DUF2299 family protein [Metallosphaera javensis (ex Hofmann et al. 2022)]MCG3109280.1 hypothetical protein [Metallosphaera javensis (ex Hofmann et al. 2022)]